MKHLLTGIVLLAGLAYSAPQDFRGVIEGRVLRKSTSEVIPDVLITLIRSGSANSSALSPQVLATLSAQIDSIRRSGATSRLREDVIESRVNDALKRAGVTSASPFAITDGAGGFTFKNLPEGTYTIRAAREGYFAPPANGISPTGVVKTVDLSPDRPLAIADILLVMGGVISGRVFELSGSPSRSPKTVGVYRSAYVDGREIWELGQVVSTDIRGNYLIAGVAPGDLYLGAPAVLPAPPLRLMTQIPANTPPPWSRVGQGLNPMATFVVPAPKPAPPPMVLFRDVTDPMLATKIAMGEGEGRYIDIRMQPGIGLVHTVRGTVGDSYNCLSLDGTVARSVPALLLFPQVQGVLDDLKSTFSNKLPTGNRPNGAFQIEEVPEGSFELIAPCVDPVTRRVLVGRSAIEVRGGAPVVEIPIRPGVTLAGEFLVTGPAGETLKPDTLSLTLKSLGRLPGSFVDDPDLIVIDPAGRFGALSVPEERYTFHVGNLPPGAYVEDIRQVEKSTSSLKSVFDDGFELTDQTGPIQIVIHTQGANVAGIVRTADGRPAENATVVLVPPEERRNNALRYKTATTDAEGKFIMQGVPPAQYTALAWESILATAWMNPKVFEQYKSRGRSVEVAPSFRIELQLPVIPSPKPQ